MARETWPNLDDKVQAGIEHNMCHGNLDCILGIDQLYSKVIKVNKTIQHPTKGLAIKETIFGPSIGGSTEHRADDVDQTINLKIFATSMEENENEPTIICEGNENCTEKEIQLNIARVFNTEQCCVPTTCGEKKNCTEDEKLAMDEQDAVDQLKKSLNLDGG